MRLSSSLYIRKLLASLHPPLPPQSPRESKQLLNVLESAFQRRLDETHPSPKTAAGGKHGHNDSESIPDPAHRLSHSTQSHLDNILGHPLFNQQSLTFLQTRSLAPTGIKTFDDALLNKTLDSDLVQSCALQYLQGLQKRGKRHPDHEVLAPRLARWFNAMSGPEKKELLLNEKHIGHLVSVMYADRHEREVWHWLQALYERAFDESIFIGLDSSVPAAMAYLRAEDCLVSAMIKETARRCRLQEAVQLYIQAYEYRLNSGRSSLSATTSTPEPLLRSWRQAAGAVLFRIKQIPVEDRFYDRLLEYGVPIRYSPFDPAFLQIYHPTRPSATTLCLKLKEESFVEHFGKWQKDSDRFTRRVLLESVLDAADLSLKQKKAGEARELLNFVEWRYPKLRSNEAQSDTAEKLQLARLKILKKFQSVGYETPHALQELV